MTAIVAPKRYFTGDFYFKTIVLPLFDSIISFYLRKCDIRELWFGDYD